MILRPAAPSDAAGVAGVYVASWNAGFAGLVPPRPLDAAQVARWERDLAAGPARWWLVEEADRVLGFVGTGPSRDPVDPGLGELDTIAVRPDAWRRGVGRRLMTAALEDLAAGFGEAILWTWADLEPAGRFYEATGWRASGESRDSGRQVAFRRGLHEG